jgi:transposase
MRRPKDKVIAGFDLHGNNVVIGIINQDGRRIEHRKVATELSEVIGVLQPYKARLISTAVESTFNWYWLVDGLRGAGYPIDLANPAKIEQYRGIKHADDKHDAFHLAELQRLGILPKGYIYAAPLRPVRDLLRRRSMLVSHRTALFISFKSLYTRTTGAPMPLTTLKSMEPGDGPKLYTHPANQLIAKIQLQQIAALDQSIGQIERTVLNCARELPLYEKLLTLPGVGKILGMTITMEVGDIGRFKTDGDFASYCRAVDSRRLSNGKQKGENNQKCGNRYLSWAYVEAAHCAKRSDEHCRRWYDRKQARTSTMIATKALACKLAKAGWHVMAHHTDYDPRRMFPEWAQQPPQKAK